MMYCKSCQHWHNFEQVLHNGNWRVCYMNNVVKPECRACFKFEYHSSNSTRFIRTKSNKFTRRK